MEEKTERGRGHRLVRCPRFSFLTRLWVCLAVVTAGHGCGQPIWFPACPMGAGPGELALDLNGDGQADYWQRTLASPPGRERDAESLRGSSGGGSKGTDAAGQKIELRFDTDYDGQVDLTVRPDELPPEECLHVIIVLDGVPFDILEELYTTGYFRLFPPPSRVVSVFPAMTDLALTRVFTDDTCLGYEASYYDRRRQALSNGNRVYLSGANEPWRSRMDYRCSLLLDTRAYLDPKALWRHELDGILRTIRKRQTGTVRVYSVATAGLGTRGGREAIVEYLKTVDRMCEQLTYERRGRIKFTLLADHGHDLTPGRRVSFRRPLQQAGYRLTNRLKNPSDVVWIQFGLVSCAVLHTRDPKGVGDVLLRQDGVDLVMYLDPASSQQSAVSSQASRIIVVRDLEGQAAIRRTRDGFIYTCQAGDPLRLQPVMERLRVSGRVASDGSVADRDWLVATAEHEYPDPLWRIWCAFNGLVQNPADVLVSLRDGFYCGSKMFSLVTTVASTHGALSRRSSVTFALSNHTRLPALLRVEELGRYVRQDTPRGLSTATVRKRPAPYRDREGAARSVPRL